VNGQEQLAVHNAREPVVTREDGAGTFFWGGVHPNGGETSGIGGPFFLTKGPLTQKACAAIEEQWKAFH
ncbi:MAG TPA: hypothetical protein VIS74_04825, partial [Chthoniobacterales bacterium]